MTPEEDKKISRQFEIVKLVIVSIVLILEIIILLN